MIGGQAPARPCSMAPTKVVRPWPDWKHPPPTLSPVPTPMTVYDEYATRAYFCVICVSGHKILLCVIQILS